MEISETLEFVPQVNAKTEYDLIWQRFDFIF